MNDQQQKGVDITIKTIEVTKVEQDTSEAERIALAKELHNHHQERVAEGTSDWQIEAKRGWIRFNNMYGLANHLWWNYKLFPGIFKLLGSADKVLDHLHRLDRYKQRIPMSALIKAKEALDTGLFDKGLYIIDPNFKSISIDCDPFLVGRSRSEYSTILQRSDSYILIWRWEDKLGK